MCETATNHEKQDKDFELSQGISPQEEVAKTVSDLTASVITSLVTIHQAFPSSHYETAANFLYRHIERLSGKFKRNEENRYQAECLHELMSFLDLQNVPRFDSKTGKEYSVIGRVELFKAGK